MATIVLMPIHWDANLNASFALGRALLRRGHRVHILCLPDTEERVRAQGFEFTPIFSRVFPRGTLARQYAEEASGRYLGADGFKSRIRGMCISMLDGELESAARSLRADLLLVSSQTPWVTVGAWKTGLPVATFASSLISVPDPRVPPFGTGLIPRRTLLSRVRTALAWKRLFLRKRFSMRAWDISDDVTTFARRCGFPLERIDARVETWPVVDVPALVLCPAEFDFPRTRIPADTHFVEPGIDTDRSEPPFPWERLSGSGPIVYCAMGSVATHKYTKEATTLFRAFLEAMARRPGWQGVLAAGHHLDAWELPGPPNVIVVREAPQLTLLERCSLSVSHGGFSTVKESLYRGVPMVVLPLFYDQPGIAARVVHHGVGVRGRFDGVSASKLGRLMDDVLGRPDYLMRVRRLARVFVERQGRSPSTDLIERLAAGRSLDRTARAGVSS
jgi:zeaxanthin glucosyltransferase